MTTLPTRLILVACLGVFAFAFGLRPAAAQTVCGGRTGELAIQCIQADYSPDKTLGYDQARDVLYRDIEAGASNQLEGVYSGYTITLTEGEDPSKDAFDKGINAEHIFPQSKGAGTEPQKSDMHNLYPANSSVNSARSNLPFGESPDAETDAWYLKDQVRSSIPPSNIDSYSERLGSSVWEAREAREGDVARAALYFFSVYREPAENSFFEGMRAQLLQWHKSDPASQAEKERSTGIAAEQGNENPFVLDGTLAERAYGTTSGPALVFNPVQVEAGEGAGSATLTVEYSNPDGASVTADVAFLSENSSASQDDIGGYVDQEVSFPATAPDGATRTVTVPITDDRDAEGKEEALFQIMNVSSSGDVQAGTNSSSLLAVTDNEQTLVLNEVLADPASGMDGDANQDGTRDFADDEFVEIYNSSTSNEVDLSGYQLSDGVGIKHVFPEGTTVGPEKAAVVFGGGAPNPAIPGVVQTASNGELALNNSGDTITLVDEGGTTVFSYSYDGSVSDQSITRDPQLTGSFVAHSTASGANGALFSPGKTPGGSPLPVELASFEAVMTSDGVALSWRTASEQNNAGFEVQRRSEGEEASWTSVHFEEGAGVSSSEQRYRFTDTDVPYDADRLTYRLQQVDRDGSTRLSEEVTVRRKTVTDLRMGAPFPNPARDRVTFRVAVPKDRGGSGEAQITLYDALGRELRSMQVAGQDERQVLQMDTEGLSSGTYFLRLTAGGNARTERLTVLR